VTKTRIEAIEELMSAYPNAAFIFSNGLTAREAAAMCDDHRNFYMLHGMGEAYSVAAGLKMARPDLEIVVVEGDGNAVMGMAGYSTLPAVGDFHSYVLLNGEYSTTGGQAIPVITYGPEWMGIIEIEKGKTLKTPDPPPPWFIVSRFMWWLNA